MQKMQAKLYFRDEISLLYFRSFDFNNCSCWKSGTCGTDCQWTLDDEGTLTISGSGEMYDYNNYFNCVPWYSSGDLIKKSCYRRRDHVYWKRCIFRICSLTTITVLEGSANYESDNDILFSKEQDRACPISCWKEGRYVWYPEQCHLDWRQCTFWMHIIDSNNCFRE